MMTKLFLYFIVLMAFIPLVSSGKIRPRAHRHISEFRDRTGNPFLVRNDADDSMKVIMPSRLTQDSIGNENRKRIKEVARAKPQSKPEKIGRRVPVGRPEDPENARRPVARPGGGPGGARPQGSPVRHGR